MRRRLPPTVLALLLAFDATGSPLRSQERPGIVVGAPFGNLIVGLLIPVSERVALRPDMSFGKTDRSFGSGGTRSTLSVTGGFSSLFYLSAAGPTRSYLVPRMVYRATRDNGDADLDQVEISAAFGRQGAIAERFGLYAESGIAFTYGESIAGGGAINETIRNWSAMARVGAIVRF